MSELRLPDVNRVLLSGRLTRDPDRRYAADGTAITDFDLAFHRHFRGRDGALVEQTGYATVKTYQRLAEVCAQYLHTGSAVLVEGKLQMREWTGPQNEKRQRLEIRGESVHFLERMTANPADASPGPADGGRE